MHVFCVQAQMVRTPCNIDLGICVEKQEQRASVAEAYFSFLFVHLAATFPCRSNHRGCLR